jgi:hypothetical protein
MVFVERSTSDYVTAFMLQQRTCEQFPADTRAPDGGLLERAVKLWDRIGSVMRGRCDRPGLSVPPPKVKLGYSSLINIGSRFSNKGQRRW